MHPRLDLHIIRQGLQQLNDSTYFEQRLHEFTSRLIAAIDHVIENPHKYDSAIERRFAENMRLVHAYLSGSTNNEIPFEVVYCLRNALSDWRSKETLIITQLTEDHGYHLMPVDPWEFIRNTLTDFDTDGFDVSLAMLGVPRLYAHKPLFCIPLYHELGHYVDVTFRITDVSLLIDKSSFAPPGCNEKSHRREYFADLFSACYLGRPSISTLELIAPNQASTLTHPATADRVTVVEALLKGDQNRVVDMFQMVLNQLGVPLLAPQFREPDINEAYGDLKIYITGDMEEIHGLFGASWNYLFRILRSGANPWGVAQLSEGEIEEVVNDLTEKSIRNYSIRRAWNEATSP